jgi:hypothetical protein
MGAQELRSGGPKAQRNADGPENSSQAPSSHRRDQQIGLEVRHTFWHAPSWLIFKLNMGSRSLINLKNGNQQLDVRIGKDLSPTTYVAEPDRGYPMSFT